MGASKWLLKVQVLSIWSPWYSMVTQNRISLVTSFHQWLNGLPWYLRDSKNQILHMTHNFASKTFEKGTHFIDCSFSRWEASVACCNRVCRCVISQPPRHKSHTQADKSGTRWHVIISQNRMARWSSEGVIMTHHEQPTHQVSLVAVESIAYTLFARSIVLTKNCHCDPFYILFLTDSFWL